MLHRVFVFLLILGLVRGARAQIVTATEGQTEFVLPAGARAVGIGQAAVASSLGGEAVWWNPALIARGSREVFIGSTSGTPPAESDLTAVFLYTLPRVMSVAISGRYVNYGTGDATIDPGTTTGSFVNAAYILGATFAAPFGERLALGTTLKMLTINFDCTGTCPNQPQDNPVTGAVDLGAQYRVRRDSSVIVGAALRNLGLSLQFNDAPQADPSPSRLDVGVEVRPRIARYPGVGLRLFGAVVTGLSGSEEPGLRAGAEASWLNQYFGRVGYARYGSIGTGPSLGGGIARGRWRVDFAQFLSDYAEALGTRPTYFTLRYVF